MLYLSMKNCTVYEVYPAECVHDIYCDFSIHKTYNSHFAMSHVSWKPVYGHNVEYNVKMAMNGAGIISHLSISSHAPQRSER